MNVAIEGPVRGANPHDDEYLAFLRHVLMSGEDKSDRTGTGTVSYPGLQMRFDLTKGFPLLTTKKVHWPSVVTELLWMLRGDTNVHYLNEHGVTIWDEWADTTGDLGPIYGEQWRTWRSEDGLMHDQIADALRLLKEDPDSRRIVVSAWNVGDLEYMALAPCHCLFQFYTREVMRGNELVRELSCILTQRSADAFLGVPFNIASYALLTHIMAHLTGMEVGELVWNGGDCHIYHNHRAQVHTQLARSSFPPPRVTIDPGLSDLDALEGRHIRLINYRHHPAIKAPVAV